MAKTKLFEAWSFRLQQPAPFDDPKYAGSKSMGFSQYNTSSTAQKSTLHAPTMRALLAYAKLVSATENGQSVDGLGAIGHQGTTYRISEYRSANKTDCVVFNPVTGKFNAAQVEDGTQALKPYSVGAGNGTGSGLLFCLMPVLNEDDEFRQKFQEFVSLLESGWADMDAAFECALTLCDNVYRRIENSKQLGSDGVKISIPTTGNISVITQMAMDSGNYAPTGASYGEFTIMQMSGTPTAKASSFQKEDFVAKYALSNRTLTARELAMVPTLPDWYIIPKEVVRVCEHAKVTTASSQPMRNFLFRGEAGTGKTMGAQAIAAGLNLPYTLMTCSANTEITDLVGQFIPDTGNFQSDFNCTELPKISDITMHPPSVYMMLTGEYDEEKTEDDVLQKLIEIAVGNLVEKEETPGQRIRYVDTPLVEAIRHGYVCELQEPSCIANPGVLVGLNSLLDNCQVITLPTGERVKRHPDTVIVVTTNSDYSGCRDMNQSVISRNGLQQGKQAVEEDLSSQLPKAAPNFTMKTTPVPSNGSFTPDPGQMNAIRAQAERVISEESDRIAAHLTNSITSSGSGGVDQNSEYDGYDYEHAAEDIERLLEHMAEEKVTEELEEELSEELQREANSIRYGNAHRNIHITVNRMARVDQNLIDSYNRVAPELLMLSKRLQRSVSSALRDRRQGGKQTGLLIGKRLNQHALHRTDGRIFYNSRLPTEPINLSVGLLIDESGSMCSNDRITRARATAIVIQDFCESLGIPLLVVGHTAWSSHVELFSYSDFDTYDKNNRYRLMDMSARDCNRDGAALRFVAEKLSKQTSEVKILMIICDGQPNDDGYSGSAAEADLRGIKLEYARKGVKIYAAAIGEDRPRIERIYGDGYLDITNLQELPVMLTNLIVRSLPH